LDGAVFSPRAVQRREHDIDEAVCSDPFSRIIKFDEERTITSANDRCGGRVIGNFREHRSRCRWDNAVGQRPSAATRNAHRKYVIS
jgi:hypothetical protein